MAPLVITHYRSACPRVVLCMECVDGRLSLLESFDFVRLPHHGLEQAAHYFDNALLQFVSSAAVPVELAVGETKPPDREHAVDVVADPRIGIVPVFVDGGARRQ